MVVGSNGALGTLQELGGLATSRLQSVLGSNGAGLAELIGTSKITNSAPVQALIEIGEATVGRLMERASGGKELEAIKDIGNVLLGKLMTTVQEVAGQMSQGGGSSITSRLGDLGGLAKEVLDNTGLTSGFAKLAESAMAAIGNAKS